jgi:uncharacterized protein (TIGR03067 family)
MLSARCLPVLGVAGALLALTGCGKGQGPGKGNVSIQVGPGAAKRPSPLSVVQGQQFWDNRHTYGGAVDRLCAAPAWTSSPGNKGKVTVECKGVLKATGQDVVLRWEVTGRTCRMRGGGVGGGPFSAADCECLLFPDVSRHAGLESLQGVWQAVSYERDGKAEPDKARGRKLVVAGNHWTLQTGAGLQKGTFAHNAQVTPHHLDMVAAGQAAAKPRRGIYEVRGDTLKLCQSPRGRERPAGFETKAGSRQRLAVYRRGQP